MTEQSPSVSICIPTFNRSGMVERAIESALSQTYHDLEVIVVDNASDDNTEDVVASYADPRLKFFKNPKNLGLFGNFNRCIELSRGDLIHILHSDDYIDPLLYGNMRSILQRTSKRLPHIHFSRDAHPISNASDTLCG